MPFIDHMDSSFLAYLQRLEMMAFFSGYPLVYYIALFLTGNKKANENSRSRLLSLLPYTYALVGTLYLGLLLKNLYPDYSIDHVKLKMPEPYLVIWGLLSIFFWIPVLRRKPVYSLLHSLVFFFFLVEDIFLHFFGLSSDEHIVRNDMKIYTVSIVLNLATLAFIAMIFLLFSRFIKRPGS